MSATPPWWRAATRAERAAGAQAPPDWWRRIEATLAPGTRSPVGAGEQRADADLVRGTLRFVAPFVRRAQHELRAHPSAGDALARSLATELASQLVELCRPAVALELVAARAAEAWPAAELSGRTAAFLRELGRAERALELLRSHPGLARMLDDRSRLAVGAGRELLDRVAADLPAVREGLLGGADPGAAVAATLAGDAHDGGRRVAVVGFERGASAVLKPRSLEPERAYGALLGELSRLGFRPALRAPRTLVAGPLHGWQEHVRPASCASAAELERYYRRLGGQLAILHALRATDMHQENVLACGEHPVLVDLETVLHPRLGGERAALVDPLIAETGCDCVLRVGLLPRADVAFGVDIGGLGRDPAGVHEADRLGWVGDGAEARLVSSRLRLPAGDNVARLGGRPVRPHEHVRALAAGFADAYRLLVAHRERLLGADGALAAFDGLATRVVLRPTKVYVDLLRRQSSDLGALDDGPAREAALDVLQRGAERRPELGVAAAAERHDLWLGDVPKITTTAGARDGDGAHHALGRLPAMLGPHPAPGPQVVRRLGERDLERQLSFLRGSVLAAAAHDGAQPAGRAFAVPASRIAVAAAPHAGLRLAALALHDGDQAGWLAPVRLPPAAGRVLRPVGAGLRDGQAGIALLLGLLGDDGPAGLAAAAWARLRAQIASSPPATDADRGELLLALPGLADERARAERAWALAASAAGDEPSELLVLGLAAAQACVADERLRARLAAAAWRLAEAPPSGRPGTALALAAAAAQIGAGRGAARHARAARDTLAAAGRAAQAVDPGRATLARIAALAAVARGGPQALRRELRETLAGLPDGAVAAGHEPTARRFAAPLILRAAAAAAGERAGAGARALADRLVAGLDGDVTFEAGAETPTLDGGLAGIGLGRLALAGDRRAGGALVATWSLPADREAVFFTAKAGVPQSLR